MCSWWSVQALARSCSLGPSQYCQVAVTAVSPHFRGELRRLRLIEMKRVAEQNTLKMRQTGIGTQTPKPRFLTTRNNGTSKLFQK